MALKREQIFSEADGSESEESVLSDDCSDEENHNDLSSYEKERLANIQKNEIFFKELKMEEVSIIVIKKFSEHLMKIPYS